MILYSQKCIVTLL